MPLMRSGDGAFQSVGARLGVELGMTTQDFRIEKDSLGEMRVPANALYGVQTARAVENFPISGLRPWRAFIWSIAIIKRAAAEVNFDLGLFHDREMDGHKFTSRRPGGCHRPGVPGSDGHEVGLRNLSWIHSRPAPERATT